jgi:hypothetical protein
LHVALLVFEVVLKSAIKQLHSKGWLLGATGDEYRQSCSTVPSVPPNQVRFQQSTFVFVDPIEGPASSCFGVRSAAAELAVPINGLLDSAFLVRAGFSAMNFTTKILVSSHA